MRKRDRILTDIARQCGFTLEHTKGGHLKFVKEGVPAYVVPSTPRTDFYTHNLLKKLIKHEARNKQPVDSVRAKR